MTRRLKILAALAAVSALALFAQKVHESDPPAVFRTEVKGSIGHCYKLQSPIGSQAIYCDVRSPATGKDYGVVIVMPGGVAIHR